MMEEWNDFNKGKWCEGIDVRDFINKNYVSYEGDESFLVGRSNKTDKVWTRCEELLQ